MPKFVVALSDHANHIVNVVKARDGLRRTSAAIERIVEEYEEKILDPALRPEFEEDLKRIRRRRFKKVGSLDGLIR